MNVADLIFVRLANVEHKNIFPGIEAVLEFLGLNLGNLRARFGFGLFSANAAELVVINQFLDRRIRAADRALRILAHAQLAEAHSQRIHQQQAADQRRRPRQGSA